MSYLCFKIANTQHMTRSLHFKYFLCIQGILTTRISIRCKIVTSNVGYLCWRLIQPERSFITSQLNHDVERKYEQSIREDSFLLRPSLSHPPT